MVIVTINKNFANIFPRFAVMWAPLAETWIYREFAYFIGLAKSYSVPPFHNLACQNTVDRLGEENSAWEGTVLKHK